MHTSTRHTAGGAAGSSKGSGGGSSSKGGSSSTSSSSGIAPRLIAVDVFTYVSEVVDSDSAGVSASYLNCIYKYFNYLHAISIMCTDVECVLV
jgi:hypothetical protein